MTILTRVQVSEIAAKAAKATPGPWSETCRDSRSPENPDAGLFSGLGHDIEGPPEPQLRGQFALHADADFIAAARIDVPALCATIGELKEVLELCCCAENETCSKSCAGCETARRIEEALK